MAKTRLSNLCQRHLFIDRVVPKAKNKIGYYLLKNGLFCLLYILIFADDAAAKAELF